MNRKIPKHIAIIMDGNGRWAKERGLSRNDGHKEGALVARNILKRALDIGIPYLTLYAFSSENWNRSEDEVSGIFTLMGFYLEKEASNFKKSGIKFIALGDVQHLPKKLAAAISKLEQETHYNDKLTLCLALNYGSRQEIVEATKKICNHVINNEMKISDVNMESFSNYLYTKGIPDPDLLIRTSGEQRISNFLLWQLAYTELCFIEKYWPSFTEADLDKAIEEYNKRERRYGTI
jgi:undecaprenyl diphosphate synthase